MKDLPYQVNPSALARIDYLEWQRDILTRFCYPTLEVRKRKVNIQNIQNNAIDYAAWILHYATLEDRKAIAEYGGCIRIGARPGLPTQAKFEGAMNRVKCADYIRFRAMLEQPEKEYLDDKIAVLIARLEAPRGRL